MIKFPILGQSPFLLLLTSRVFELQLIRSHGFFQDLT